VGVDDADGMEDEDAGEEGAARSEMGTTCRFGTTNTVLSAGGVQRRMETFTAL
jgi:hypothetical protein